MLKRRGHKSQEPDSKKQKIEEIDQEPPIENVHGEVFVVDSEQAYASFFSPRPDCEPYDPNAPRWLAVKRKTCTQILSPAGIENGIERMRFIQLRDGKKKQNKRSQNGKEVAWWIALEKDGELIEVKRQEGQTIDDMIFDYYVFHEKSEDFLKTFVPPCHMGCPWSFLQSGKIKMISAHHFSAKMVFFKINETKEAVESLHSAPIPFTHDLNAKLENVEHRVEEVEKYLYKNRRAEIQSIFEEVSRPLSPSVYGNDWAEIKQPSAIQPILDLKTNLLTHVGRILGIDEQGKYSLNYAECSEFVVVSAYPSLHFKPLGCDCNNGELPVIIKGQGAVKLSPHDHDSRPRDPTHYWVALDKRDTNKNYGGILVHPNDMIFIPEEEVIGCVYNKDYQEAYGSTFVYIQVDRPSRFKQKISLLRQMVCQYHLADAKDKVFTLLYLQHNVAFLILLIHNAALSCCKNTNLTGQYRVGSGIIGALVPLDIA